MFLFICKLFFSEFLSKAIVALFMVAVKQQKQTEQGLHKPLAQQLFVFLLGLLSFCLQHFFMQHCSLPCVLWQMLATAGCTVKRQIQKSNMVENSFIINYCKYTKNNLNYFRTTLNSSLLFSACCTSVHSTPLAHLLTNLVSP